MKSLVFSLSLLTGFIYAGERQAYSVERRVITFRVSLMTKEGRHLNDTVTAESENDARDIIRARYPSCTIFRVYQIR